jgi:hypothetical protein
MKMRELAERLRIPQNNRIKKGDCRNMDLFYSPEYAKTGDVIPFYDRETGKFENYYLKNMVNTKTALKNLRPIKSSRDMG